MHLNAYENIFNNVCFLTVLEIPSLHLKTMAVSCFASTEDKLDELKIIFLEEEIKELKRALRESRNRNAYLSQVLEQKEDVKKKQ